jgi:hypothetical protein
MSAAAGNNESTGTAVAENYNEDPITFVLDPIGIVKYNSYPFLRLIATTSDGKRYNIPFYKSSGTNTGLGGVWFPCKGAIEGRIEKGTPDSVPKFYKPGTLLKDESMFYRVPSELGLRGMAAINVLTPEQFETLKAKFIDSSPAIAATIEYLLNELETEFQTDADLKAQIRTLEPTATEVTLPALQTYLSAGGLVMGGGKRRRTRRSRMRRTRNRTMKKK